jgi:hypothetical protein
VRRAKINLAFSVAGYGRGAAYEIYFAGCEFMDNYAPRCPSKAEPESNPPSYFFKKINFVTAKIAPIWISDLHGAGDASSIATRTVCSAIAWMLPTFTFLGACAVLAKCHPSFSSGDVVAHCADRLAGRLTFAAEEVRDIGVFCLRTIRRAASLHRYMAA